MKKPSSITRRALLRTLGSAGAVLALPRFTHSEQPLNQPRFVDVSRAAGITFEHYNAASPEKYLIETMGSGCGWIDYDQNGLLDLYLVNGASARPNTSKHAARSALYRNNGAGTFTDATITAGVGAEGMFGMGVAVGDYDK